MFTSSRRRLRVCWLVLTIVVLVAVQAGPIASNITSPQQVGSVTEWTVPTRSSGPWGLALDQSGACCWFVEYYGNKIAHFDSLSGSFQEWKIPSSDSNPYSVAVTMVGHSLMVWGTEFSSDKIFAFSPGSGQFNEYSLSGGSGVGYISIEPQAGTTRVWFTETIRNRNGEFIYDPASENVTLYEDTFPAPVGGGAYGVYAGSGYVWFAGFSALVRWDRASAQYVIWPLPNHNSTVARSIALDSHGQLWYTQGEVDGNSSDNFVGTLAGNMIQEWRLPGAGSDPREISINPLTEQPWVAEQSSLAGSGAIANLNEFGNSTLFSSPPITSPSGGRAAVLSPRISHAPISSNTVAPTSRSIVASQEGPFAQYALGPSLPSNAIVDSSGNAWVSEPGANKIARLTLSPDYALSLSSLHPSSTPGTSIPITVTGVSVSGYAGDVTFTPLSLPPGITVSNFNPNPIHISSDANASSNLAINVATTTSPGTISILIQGSDGQITHSISLILIITNSTSSTINLQLETRCLVTIPIYLPQSALLAGLTVDLLIGAAYIGLPAGYFSRKLPWLRGLNRKSWMIILLLGPSALSVGSVLLLFC